MAVGQFLFLTKALIFDGTKKRTPNPVCPHEFLHKSHLLIRFFDPVEALL